MLHPTTHNPNLWTWWFELCKPKYLEWIIIYKQVHMNKVIFIRVKLCRTIKVIFIEPKRD